MAKLKALKVTTEASQEGVWINYYDGARLRVARVGNDKFTAMVRALSKTKRNPSEEHEDITREASARTLLVDWENIEEEDGTPIPYSWQQALEWFEDPELSDMYLTVLKEANNLDNYRNHAQEVDSGN